MRPAAVAGELARATLTAAADELRNQGDTHYDPADAQAAMGVNDDLALDEMATARAARPQMK
eukprot:gene6660-3875_t